MATPYIIQPGDLLYGYNIGDGNQGPFEHGGATYVVVSVYDAPTQVAVRTGVFKSTDSGVTFTEMDSAHAPLSPPPGYTTSCFYPASGGSVIYFLAEQGSDRFVNPLAIFSFDMATDTWTTIATGGPTANGSPVQLMVRTSTGEFVFGYAVTGGTTTTIYGVTWSSGWGTPVALGTYTGTSAMVSLIGIDNSDKVVILWSSFGDTQNYVNTWTSGGGFSSRSVAFPLNVTLWNPFNYDEGQGWNAQGKFVSAENKIGWCLPFFPTPSTIQPTMLIADMSVTPPTFSTTAIASDINAQEDTFWTDFCISPDGSTFTAMWTWQGPGVGNTPNQLLQATAAALGGPWAAESVYWDNVTDPPVMPPPQEGGLDGPNFPNSVSVRQLSFGIRALIGLFPIQAGQSVYQGQYFLSVPTQTLQLIKQVSGGTAVATDWTLSAAGPTPISGAGGVGPSNVDAGTYTLTETAVTDYTLEALVCVGGTQVGNQITLAAGQSSVCTFTNLFTGVMPPPPPPPFCIPFEPETPSPSLVAYDEPLELKGS